MASMTCPVLCLTFPVSAEALQEEPHVNTASSLTTELSSQPTPDTFLQFKMWFGKTEISMHHILIGPCFFKEPHVCSIFSPKPLLLSAFSL